MEARSAGIRHRLRRPTFRRPPVTHTTRVTPLAADPRRRPSHHSLCRHGARNFRWRGPAARNVVPASRRSWWTDVYERPYPQERSLIVAPASYRALSSMANCRRAVPVSCGARRKASVEGAGVGGVEPWQPGHGSRARGKRPGTMPQPAHVGQPSAASRSGRRAFTAWPAPPHAGARRPASWRAHTRSTVITALSTGADAQMASAGPTAAEEPAPEADGR